MEGLAVISPNGKATITNRLCRKITQIINIIAGGNYGDPYLTFITANQMYNEAHNMYKRK